LLKYAATKLQKGRMTSQGFSTLRAFLWPVHREEYPKFIPMLLISFLICFNYYFLRIFKDAIMITAPSSGAEALPFLKVWAILPTAVLMTFLFTRISNWLSRRTVFYAMIWFYIAYFIVFTLFLYPNQDSLHPHALADKLETILPKGCRGLIACFRNWTFTTFYVMSEMWSTMIMTVLFWGFANDVTTVKDSKRFYGLFGVGTNLSGVVAGLLAGYLSGVAFNPSLPFGKTAWDQSVVVMNLIVVGSSLACMGLYWWMNRRGLGYTDETLKAHRESPVKMGMRKNFSYLANSKYLTCIALLVVAFNIVINLSEVAWKDQVKQLYPSASEFQAYMAGVTFWMALLAAFVSLFISGNAIRAFGWTKSALIAPILTLVTGALFFAALLLPKDVLLSICSMIGTSPLILAVFLGSLQNCIVRGTKYSLVDATKEMAFIPLNLEARLKGKAAIDGVGSRLGKSGGSLMYQCLLLVFGSVVGSTPVVAFLLLGSTIAWIYAVRSLGGRYQQLTADQPTSQTPQAASRLS
jgi:AAA family ATP:ADP antiporter